MKNDVRALLLSALLVVGFGPSAQAGEVFLTGHDPDFHSQSSAGARNLLRAGLSFVTEGTYDLADGNKFLWIESRIATPGGHRIGENGLVAVGLVLGVHYERVNAAELVGADFSAYTALVIASSFGGLLTRAELDGLIARSEDIKDFVNAGGGLMAMSECFPCGANLLAGLTPPDLFGYLPVEVSSIPPAPPFNVTPIGAADPFFLTNGDINDPTHNSFGLIGGLDALDLDQSSQATTLAGDVLIGGGGFDVCEPDPRSQGYWHRQCLGLPETGDPLTSGIDPGRNGRGPQEPTEPTFEKELLPAVNLTLQNLLFEFQGTCGSMDADPPSDKCERALKQFTAMLLNIESGLLGGGSGVTKFSFDMDASQSEPPNGSPGTGSCSVTLDESSGDVSVDCTYSGLVGTTFAAHIHGLAPSGVNAAVIVPLTAVGAMAGTITGGGTLTAGQVQGMLDGLTYVNLHTDSNPTGEIRGQVEGGTAQSTCSVDPDLTGCESENLSDLVTEIAGLINDGTQDSCNKAATCAAAVNENLAGLEGLALTNQTTSTSEGVQPRSAGAVLARASVAVDEPAAGPVLTPDSTDTGVVVLGAALQVEEPEHEAEEKTQANVATDEDPLDAIQRHLVVVAHASSPEAARSISTDALLTALSGGYELETRIEIVQGLFLRIDDSLVSLLVEHVRDIRDEAHDFGHQELVNKAERLLRRLEVPEE